MLFICLWRFFNSLNNICCFVLSHSLMSNTLQLHQAPLFIGILQARIMEWVAMPSSRGSSQPVIKPRAPSLEVDSLPSEPPGKPRNTGAGSLSLLQKIFLTQESNWGLLDCRRFLSQQSYQGISYMYTYIPSLLNFPPTLFRLTPLGHHRTPSWAPCPILQNSLLKRRIGSATWRIQHLFIFIQFSKCHRLYVYEPRSS